jgi:aryl-alcohol dehydrogenase (NADP+)
MEYRQLDQLKVSRICLGGWMFGGHTERAVAGRIISSAREAGANFLDTADVYAGGESEVIIGRHIAQDRDRWVLATKVGIDISTKSSRPGGLGRKWVLPSIEASLQRLRTDYIDIYYLHEPDRATPLEETLETFGYLIKQGKVRYFGFSNYRGWQIADMAHLCDQNGIPRPVVCQSYYNALNRTAEAEILPACAHFGIGMAAYSPLAGGLLSGKYAPDKEPVEGSRVARKDTRFSEAEFRKDSLLLASRICSQAKMRGMTAVQFAVRWVLSNALVTTAIVGPRTEAQWLEYLGALEQELDAGDEALVSSLVPPGQPSTPGYLDPWTPVTERTVAWKAG